MPSQARLSVTVPTSYGFVVMGTVNTADTNPVSSDAGTILLPHVRIEDSIDGTGHSIVWEGTGQVPLKNYSTDVREENVKDVNPKREGLPVEMKAYVLKTPSYEVGGVQVLHNWKPVAEDPTGDINKYKQYRLGIGNSNWFDTPGVISDGTAIKNVIYLHDNLPLPAPPDVATNGWNAGGLANVSSNTYYNVDVQVGGQRGQYNTTENSIKVSMIGWEIIPGELPPATTP